MTFERSAYRLLPPDTGHPQAVLPTLLVLLVLVANLLFSGFISGWASTQLFLIDEDQYHDRCESTTRCAAQESQLSLIYGVAQFTTTLSSFPAGLFLDKAGPVATSLVAGVLSATGFALMAVSDSVTFDGFIEGYCLIGVGGTLTLLTSFQAGFVHLPWQTLVLAAANCLFDASAVMPSVLYALHTALGVSRQTLLLIYAGLALAVYPLLALCWHLHRGKKEVNEEKRLLVPSWSTQLVSRSFGFLAVFASVHNLQSAIFFGTINRILAVDGDRSLVYTRAFGWVLPVGFLAVPLLHAVVRNYTVLGAMASTSLLCIAYHVLLLLPSLELQAMTFVVFTTFRGFLYSTVAAFAADTFGVASLGSLLGALYSLCALLALSQVPIVVAANANPRWAQHMYLVSLATAASMLAVIECYRRYRSVHPVSTESKDLLTLPLLST